MALETAVPAAADKIRLFWKRIEALDPIVTDRRRAATLRQQYLDSWSVDEGAAVLVDLNPIHVLSLSAADELIVKWLERARTRRSTLVAVIATFDHEVKETIDRALREGRQAAYYVRSSPIHDETPEVIGDVTSIQRDTLHAMQKLPPVTGKLLADSLRLQANTANMRLAELYQRGLLLRDADRNGSTVYRAISKERVQLVPPMA